MPPNAGSPEQVAPVVSLELTPSAPDRADGEYTGPVIVTPHISDDSAVADVRCVLDPAAAPASFDELPTGACEFVGGASVDARGAHAFYLAARDIWNNESEVASVAFSIDWPFEFRGFMPPLLAAPALNAARAGQVLPIKFRVSGDQKLAAVGGAFVVSAEVDCGTRQAIGHWSLATPAGRSTLVHAPATGQLTYPWSVPKEWRGTCRKLALRLVDGSRHYAFFEFR